MRRYMEVGYRCGYKAAIAFRQVDFTVCLVGHFPPAVALCAFNSDGAVARKTHVNNETVVFIELPVKGPVDFE